MPLETRVISINFATGLDQKTDDKLTAKLTTADNAVLRKNGTIEKRLGFVSAGTWGITPNPIKVIPFNDSFVAISDTTNPSSNTSNAGWNKMVGLNGSTFTTNFSIAQYSRIKPCSIKTQTLLSGINSVTAFDACLFNGGQLGLVATGALSSGPATFLKDTNSSDIKNVGSPVGPSRVVALTASSTVAYVCSVNSAATTIVFRDLQADGSTGAVAGTVPGSDTAANQQFDAVAWNSKIYFVTKAVSSTGLLLGWFDPSNSTTSVTTIPASCTADMVSFATQAPGTTRLHVIWAKNTASNTGFIASYSATLSQILAATSITTCTSSYGPGLVTQIAACENGSLTFVGFFATCSSTTALPVVTSMKSLSVTTAAVVDSAEKPTHKSCSLVAKPAIIDGQPAIALNNSATGQQSLVLGCYAFGSVVEMQPVARCLYGTAGPNGSTSYVNLPAISSDGNGKYYVPTRNASFYSSNAGSITIGYSLELVVANFSQTQAIPFVKLQNTTIFGGGFVSHYDGLGPFDNNFLGLPTIATVSTTTTGGSLTSAVYSCIVVKEFIDEAGKVHIGTPSLPSVFTTSTTTSAATVTFCDSIRTKVARGNTRFVAYRTAGNGSLYYRDSITTSTDWGVYTANTLSFTVSDATLGGGSVVYTQGGILPWWSPDSCDVLFAHGMRIFCNDPSDPTILHHSNELVPGEALRFTQTNIVRIPGQGLITAGASMDSSAIVFRARTISAFAGDGPDDTGLNGSFSDGQIIAADVGCIDQRSLCRFKDGIVFKSPDKGFYLLTRDFQLSYIGADVENYNSKTVVSSEVVGLAEVDGTAEECRFLCSDNTLLTYNYYNQQWTTATLSGCVDAVQTGGKYVVANTSSTVASARMFQQSLTTYTDAFSNTSATYQMTIETGWLKVADVQGFQRMREANVTGKATGPGDISFEVAYDYETAYNETHTISMSSATAANYTGAATAIAQFNVNFTRQKCEAIRFRLKDVPSAGNTSGVFRLTNISLECGVKAGLFKLPPAKNI